MTTTQPPEPSLQIDPYERGWIIAAIALLAVFALAVTVAGAAMGIQLPAPELRVNPQTVAMEGPFAQPGVRELAPGRYEAYILTQTWLFNPREITVPKGSEITLYVTSRDVQHGFKLEGTNINMQIVPGQVSRLTFRATKPGTYNFVCHEYCGLGHAAMFGSLIVTE